MKSLIAGCACLGSFACGVVVSERWGGGVILTLVTNVLCLCSLWISLVVHRRQKSIDALAEKRDREPSEN